MSEYDRTTGVGSGIAIAVLLPGTLLVCWLVQLIVYIRAEVGQGDDRLSDGAVLGWYLGAAALPVLVSALTVIVQLAIRRYDEHYSIVGTIAALVVLAIALLTNGTLIGSHLVSTARSAYEQAQPPTAAETHFAGGDARAGLREIGDHTVELLGGDPSVRNAADGSTDHIETRRCSLRNGSRGTEYVYSYPDLSPTPTPEAAPVPGDIDAVQDYWKAQGIRTVRVDGRPEPQIEARVPWLSPDSFARVGPAVQLVSACLAD